MIVGKLFSGILILFLYSGCQTPELSPPAQRTDKNHSLRVSRNIPIPSQFKDLPLVEPHVSAHPNNNNHLLVSAMVVTDVNRPYESCRLSTFISTDGGNRWNETAHNYWGYDPWTTILADGHTVMSWIGTEKSFQDKYPIVFFTSDDAGMTWSSQTQTLPGNHDGTKLTSANNTIYFTTVYFKEHMSVDVRVYRSKDKGPFEMTGFVDGKGERLAFAESSILSDGTIVVPLSTSKKQAWVQTSTNGGRTFSEPFAITTTLGERKGYFHLVSDTQSSKFKDRLYFVRAAGYGDSFDGILLNYSNDKGRTWSPDRRVDLFDGNGKGKPMVPTIAVNAHGIVGISWVDSRNDPARNKTDIYFTISMDGGESFQQPVRITEVSSNPRSEKNSDVANKFPGGGHYLGLTSRLDDSFQLVWSDSRNGLFQLQTCNVAVVR
jgi:hypothetical protein